MIIKDQCKFIEISPERWQEYKELRLEALKNDPRAFGSTYVTELALTKENWQKKLKSDDPADIKLFVEKRGKLIGIAGSYRAPIETASHIANITSVYITPSERGKGLAKKLILRLLDKLVLIGDILKVELRVNTEQEAAIKTYRACGFKIAGKLAKETMIDNVSSDEYIMQRFLTNHETGLFRLDEDIFRNKCQYYFVILGPRFDPVVDMMSKSLAKKFGKPFRPIYIVSAIPNNRFIYKNYIVINEHLKKLGEDAIYLQDYEDQNAEFMQSKFINKLIDKLSIKQDKIFVYSFTTSFLSNENPKLSILGPSPTISKYYDNKINQYNLFAKIGLPTCNYKTYKNITELDKEKKFWPRYIYASYASGGSESGIIKSKKDFIRFKKSLRTVNQDKAVLTVELFKNIKTAPNSSAIVLDKSLTKALYITDQIMDGNSYLGNIFPSSLRREIQEKITDYTIRIGNYLSEKGFRGLFGCDFLVDNTGKLVIGDLNPRRQGGYCCNALALQTKNISITDLELSAILSDRANQPVITDDLSTDFCWAHSKIKTHNKGLISKEILRSDPNIIFKRKNGIFAGTYYKKGSQFISGFIGYVMATAKCREDVLIKVRKMTKKIVNDSFIGDK